MPSSRRRSRRNSERLADAHGGTEIAQRELAKLVAAQIDDRGALDVLRHGVKDRGVTIRLAYFRPSHTLADGALDQYQANRLTVARQFHYSARDPASPSTWRCSLTASPSRRQS